MPVGDLELMVRILLAAALGAIVGVERERRRMPAGFRTFMLVSVGSALFMIISIYGFDDSGSVIRDPARIAAQVVTGIGFLGAGMLLRTAGSIRGLTTAAGIWVMAAIGMAAGAGMYTIAAFSTLVVATAVLWILREFERGNNHDQDSSEQER